MARQNIKPNPSEKLFESYMDFSGGLNSETANESLKDNEVPVLMNVDMNTRGSLRRRSGRKFILDVQETAQGMFQFFRKGKPTPDLIIAIKGKLYVMESDTTETKTIEIKDGSNAFTFQDTLPIEGVMMGDKMYIATGTKLLELSYVDGDDTDTEPDQWKCTTVVPYIPNTMEAIYIGLNALSADPKNYISDKTGNVNEPLRVDGIKAIRPTGVTQRSEQFIAYTTKPSGMTLQFKWEVKSPQDMSWIMVKDWTDDPAGKTLDYSFLIASNWAIKVSARDKNATTTVASYQLTNYKVNDVEDKEANKDVDAAGINTCRRIMNHWDRLILAGDSKNPSQIYVSDLSAPAYFPTSNVLVFDGGKKEPVTSLVRYRDYLVIFTRTTIHTLNGKSPEEYQIGMIHDGIGCIAPRSAKVVGNHVFFLSAEGVHYLRPNALVLESLNVFRVDGAIKSQMTKDENAVAMVYDAQYWLCIPSKFEIYRFYYDTGIWTKDYSSKLNIVAFSNYGADIYELSAMGTLYKQDSSYYMDNDEVYTMQVDSKFLDLSASFNYKKLKKIYVMARHFVDNVHIAVKVYADSAIALNPDQGEAVVQDGSVVWKSETKPNMDFYAGTALGSWVLSKVPLGATETSVQKASVRGKCRRVKVSFKHMENTPCEIYGFGLEFKAKKV
jgi:hypothetical protein